MGSSQNVPTLQKLCLKALFATVFLTGGLLSAGGGGMHQAQSPPYLNLGSTPLSPVPEELELNGPEAEANRLQQAENAQAYRQVFLQACRRAETGPLFGQAFGDCLARAESLMARFSDGPIGRMLPWEGSDDEQSILRAQAHNTRLNQHRTTLSAQMDLIVASLRSGDAEQTYGPLDEAERLLASIDLDLTS
jgi:hypothetical protein